jgi:2-amino-4-hydroxy-6-hydroxymethyldihydropteridine diphosphokinase
MIHLNIGSNLHSKFGNRFENISIAVNLLINSKINIIKVSKFYETPSYPNKKLPYFINIGALVNYKDDEVSLIKKINFIENKIGRIKTKKNDPRVCDIDIIDFKGRVISHKNLQIPHPKCHLRNFVLYPIKEIDRKWTHPILKKNVEYLINKLDQNSRIEITRLNKNVIIKS